MRRLILLAVLLPILLGPATARAEGLSKSEIKRLTGALSTAIRDEDWGKARESMDALAAADTVKVFKLLTLAVERSPARSALGAGLRAAAKRMTSDKVQKHIAKTLKRSRSARVRLALILHFADAGQWGPLIVAIKDKDERVAAVAVGRLIDARVGAAVGAMIDQLERLQKKKRAGIWDLLWSELGKLLGQRHDSADGYRTRWKQVQREGGLKQVKPRKPAPGEALLAGRAVESTRVVFLLDVSGQMSAIDPQASGGAKRKTKLETRLERAQRALKAAIRKLPDFYRINIVAFATHVKLWRAQEGDDLPGLHVLNAKNRASAIQFVDSFRDDGVTATDTALIRAFEVQGARNFYLLSSGFATHDGRVQLETKALLRVLELHQDRHVIVHTLGFKGADREMLQALAKSSGGRYTDIE